MSDDDHVTRITERLAKDHPDPALRQELYADGDRLLEYVRVLMQGQDVDDAALARIADAVRAADDGQPHHDDT